MPHGPKSIKAGRRSPYRLGRVVLHVARLLGVGATGIISATLLFLLVNKIVHPYKLGDEEARKVVALRSRLAHQEEENEKLAAQLKYLSSPEGRETTARHYRYHRDKELVFFLSQDALSMTDAPAPKATPQAP